MSWCHSCCFGAHSLFPRPSSTTWNGETLILPSIMFYIYFECETLKLPPGVLHSKLQSIPPIRHCAHLFPLSCPILRAFKHNNGIYIGNSISTSLQSSRLIMLTYAPSAWSRRRLLETQKAKYTLKHEQDVRANKSNWLQHSNISICSQMFHCHDRCRVFQKPTYLTASISVRHFKWADLQLSDSLDCHNLCTIGIESCPHINATVQPAAVLANRQLPITK